MRHGGEETLDHPLRAEPDAVAADWLLTSLRPMQWRDDALPVGAFVPDGYPAVARVLHPWSDGRQPVFWSDAAKRLGESSAVALDRHRNGHDLPTITGLDEPWPGWLDAGTAAALVSALTVATATPEDVFVAVWEGWADCPHDLFPTAGRVPRPQRSHYLLRGPLDGVLVPIGVDSSRLPAGIWWPVDRAWVVVSEIDYHWTFVAGTTEFIDALMADSRLEVLHTTVDAAANNLSGDREPRPSE